MALSESRAEIAHAKLGDRVKLTLGDGTPRQARLVATYERDLGFGEVVIPASMAEGHLTTPLLDAVLISTAPGASPAIHQNPARTPRAAGRRSDPRQGP